MRDVYGIDVLAAMRAGSLELHYSEFGIGGGSSYAGDQARAARPVAASLGRRPQ